MSVGMFVWMMVVGLFMLAVFASGGTNEEYEKEMEAREKERIKEEELVRRRKRAVLIEKTIKRRKEKQEAEELYNEYVKNNCFTTTIKNNMVVELDGEKLPFPCEIRVRNGEFGLYYFALQYIVVDGNVIDILPANKETIAILKSTYDEAVALENPFHN